MFTVFLSAWFSHQWVARCSPGVVGVSEITEVVVAGDIGASGLLCQRYTRCMCQGASWKQHG